MQPPTVDNDEVYLLVLCVCGGVGGVGGVSGVELLKCKDRQ